MNPSKENELRDIIVSAVIAWNTNKKISLESLSSDDCLVLAKKLIEAMTYGSALEPAPTPPPVPARKIEPPPSFAAQFASALAAINETGSPAPGSPGMLAQSKFIDAFAGKICMCRECLKAKAKP